MRLAAVKTCCRSFACTALCGLLLAACAAGPSRNGPMQPPRGNVYERQVLGAMMAVQVNDAQRLVILNAFDALMPALKTADQDSARMRQRWETLDARAPDYASRSEALAVESGDAAARHLRALAAFNAQVAQTLTESQWQQWSKIMSADEASYGQRGGGGPGGGGPSGGGRHPR